ncbi:PTS sugar transporter subunit IIA [bacterium]|nr:PTS sugar transporter subunit IIA [bacterium]MCP5461747.1 PTS sugar transporter subunit IIA [bacterium]
MDLEKYISKDLLFTDIAASSKPELLQRIIARLCAKRPVLQPDAIYREIIKREQSSSTGIGHGLAIPHCRMPGLDAIFITVCVCQTAVDYNAVDGVPVRIVFLVLGPETHPEEFLYVFAELAKKMSIPELRENILQAHTPEEIYRRLTAEKFPLSHG